MIRTLIVASFLCGCGSEDGPAPPGGDGGTDDGGTDDAGVDAGVPCPDGSHEVPGGCDSTLSFVSGDSIAGGRDHHATFVVGSSLFVAGGTDRVDFFDDVQTAPIGADGTLGAWSGAGTLPEPLAGHSVAVVGELVVVTGGLSTGAAFSDGTWTSRVAADGTFGAWAPGPPAPPARMHHCMAASGDRVYVVGGLLGADTTDDVRSAAVRDGALGEWRVETALPESRSHEGCVVVDGALYVVGGLSGNPAGVNTPFADVLRATLGADGTLGAWVTLSEPMPHALATHSALAFGGLLWTLGGVEDNASFSAAVRRAPILEDGSTGPWEDASASLPSPRGHVHQTPLVGTRFYSVGGSQADGSVLDDVVVGSFE